MKKILIMMLLFVAACTKQETTEPTPNKPATIDYSELGVWRHEIKVKKESYTFYITKDTGPLCKKDYIIIDDICDGGATFINIAKEIKKAYSCNHIYLIVTHGIFSKGFYELCDYFDGIYCTNSYSDTLKPFEKGTMSGVHTSMEKKIINRPDNDFVKQLDVF